MSEYFARLVVSLVSLDDAVQGPAVQMRHRFPLGLGAESLTWLPGKEVRTKLLGISIDRDH